jgi:hypothetical protein
MKGWQKKWFYLWNDIDVPLPTFTGNRPVLQPNWGYGVVKKDLGKLQPLREVVQQLQREGLTGVHLLWIFFCCRIQPLRQRVIKMWLYLGPFCLGHSFSEELSETEINTCIHKVLDHGANLDPEASPAHLREGVASTRVSLFRSILVTCAILSSHHGHGLA